MYEALSLGLQVLSYVALSLTTSHYILLALPFLLHNNFTAQQGHGKDTSENN
jgi:hypothetical protein